MKTLINASVSTTKKWHLTATHPNRAEGKISATYDTESAAQSAVRQLYLSYRCEVRPVWVLAIRVKTGNHTSAQEVATADSEHAAELKAAALSALLAR